VSAPVHAAATDPVVSERALSVRLARHADAARYPVIERAAATLYAPWGLEGVLEGATTAAARVASAIEHGELLASVDEHDEMVGYALVERDGDDLHLEELAVHPSFGRRGRGTSLLVATLGLGREHGAKRVTLITLDFIPFGRAFYERRGFCLLAEGELSPRLRELTPTGEPDGRVAMARAISRRA
jgi:ribosomal protein S18 acetylase RimI-like enzyme